MFGERIHHVAQARLYVSIEQSCDGVEREADTVVRHSILPFCASAFLDSSAWQGKGKADLRKVVRADPIAPLHARNLCSSNIAI